MKALCVENLCKEYPSFRLHDVSFSVEEGRIVGLIGRNGAGKSTTMKGLLRFIRTDGGRVLFFGKDIARHEREIKEQIGYVAGGFSYYPLKKLRSIGKCAARFYKGWNADAYKNYLRAFGLDEDKKPSELSDGMKVKYFIALALSHGAKLLIMDEPTSGLDPLSREEFCDLILKVVKEEGVSVLFFHAYHFRSDARGGRYRVYCRRRGARRGGDRGTFGKIRSRLFCRNAERASRRIERSQKRIRRADRRGRAL